MHTKLDHKGKGRRSLGESVCSSQHCASLEGSYKAQQAPGKQTAGTMIQTPRRPADAQCERHCLHSLGAVQTTLKAKFPGASQRSGLRKYCVCAESLNHVRLCHPMDCSPPGSSVHGILQARTLEWVAMPSSEGSFQPRD